MSVQTAQPFATQSVAEIQAGLKAGEYSAKEIVDQSLERIEALDPSIHAFLEVTADAAYEQAKRVDEALAQGTFDELGCLAGVPVAFKDNMNMVGTHTTCSSNMLTNYVSPYTATCVERMIAAGALPLGKLNMDEFAFGSSTETSAFGPTNNPWDTTRVHLADRRQQWQQALPLLHWAQIPAVLLGSLRAFVALWA